MQLLRAGVTLAVIASTVGLASVEAQGVAETADSIKQWFSAAKENPPPSRPKPTSQEASVHYLRQSTCNIPFTVDSARTPPIELQLFVSTDQGAHWEYTARAAPTSGSFTFRAVREGEHWFALRTIDKSALPADPRSLQPGLKVVFDTQPPKLELELTTAPDGAVNVNCTADDPSLDPESLRMEYQLDPNGPWQNLSVPKSGGAPGKELSARHLVRLDPHGATALVRAEVRDRAGNNAVVSRQVTWRESPVARPVSQGNGRVAMQTDSASDGSVHWPRNNTLPPRDTMPPPSSVGTLPPPKPSANLPQSAFNTEAGRRPYFTTSTPAGRNLASSDESDGAPTITSNSPEVLSAEARPAGSGGEIPEPRIPQSTSPFDPPLPPPTEGTLPRDNSAGDSKSASASQGVPTRDRPRMTNSRRFSLDYEVQAIGPSAVERVELWRTSDGGRAWARWQDDEDRMSPVELQLDRDGVFGFRIVVSSRQLSTPTPQPGEPADIWIGVDTTRPTARLTAALYGEGEHAGQFDIRWQALDTSFGERPITLSFSEHANGPWSTIAAGLPNTGQFFWTVEPRIPREIYLRVTATDDAGNIGEHQTSDPVSTSGLIPHARIRGIRLPTSDRSASTASDPR